MRGLRWNILADPPERLRIRMPRVKKNINLSYTIMALTPHKETYNYVVFRGGKRELDDERRIAISEYDNKLHKGGVRFQRWLIAILIFLLTSLVVINTYSTGQFQIVRLGSIGNQTAQASYVELKPVYKPILNSGFLVHNKGCRIPAMDPHDPASMRFIKKEEPILCEHGFHLPLVDSNETSIFINPSARNHFYNKSETVDCCWRSFMRKPNEDNAVTYRDECVKFKDSAIIDDEFVKIECYRHSEITYKDYHAFLPRKTSVEQRCREARAKASEMASEHLSLLIVGIDSVSRMNLHRMMPKTVKALKKLGAVEMLGYTKVADNTYPNLVPVLTGLSEEELHDLCWQNSKKPFDECPFLWKNYSAAGYRTIFGEDACGMTTFNYLKPGFRVQPTDYYLRPFCIASEHDIGNTHKLNADLCIGTRKTFDNLLHYTRKTASLFARDPYFAMFWEASLTHDFFNYPQLGDDSYEDFLHDLEREKLLNQTALVMMSDHGLRWGDFRQTYQGRMEDSLPFVFIVLPAWWRDKYQVAWANLRRNTHSLTTPFDLHETLLDLLNSQNLHETNYRKRVKVSPNEERLPRGMSWFFPIPDYRTCDMANISSHWCMCHTSNNIDLRNSDLKESAVFLVEELNKMLKKYVQCATLKLKSIKDAKVWADKERKELELIDYTITIQTTPGDAIFEGSVRYRTDDKSWKVVGSVSRLNAYGKQSACVDEFNMRLYCYCL